MRCDAGPGGKRSPERADDVTPQRRSIVIGAVMQERGAPGEMVEDEDRLSGEVCGVQPRADRPAIRSFEASIHLETGRADQATEERDTWDLRTGTPGAGFGATGEGYFRLTAFGRPENVREALERMKKI